MKIGIVSNLYPPFCIGGYERLCGEVAGELVAKGHEIVVLTSDYGGTAPDPVGQTVDRSLRLLANYEDIYAAPDLTDADREAIAVRNRQAAARFVETHRPDVLFGWNLFFCDPGFVDDLSALSDKVVLFVTDNWLIAAKRMHRIDDFFARFVHGPETFDPAATDAAPRGDTIRVPERLMYGARFVDDLYRACGFDTPNSIVIHNGVRLPMVPDNLFVDRAVFRSPGEVRLLFAGRVVDLKGPHLIVDALPAIRAALPPGLTLTLNIVGDTQDRTFLRRLEERIAASGCADLVHFVKPVPEAALLSLFNDHDIYLFPSLYEPFSLTLIHALAAGIPTVASDVGGNEEIVADGRSGLIFDRRSPASLSEAVVRLIEQPALRKRLSKAGRAIAQRFTFRRMIERIELDLVSYAAAPRKAPGGPVPERERPRA